MKRFDWRRFLIAIIGIIPVFVIVPRIVVNMRAAESSLECTQPRQIDGNFLDNNIHAITLEGLGNVFKTQNGRGYNSQTQRMLYAGRGTRVTICYRQQKGSTILTIISGSVVQEEPTAVP